MTFPKLPVNDSISSKQNHSRNIQARISWAKLLFEIEVTDVSPQVAVQKLASAAVSMNKSLKSTLLPVSYFEDMEMDSDETCLLRKAVHSWAETVDIASSLLQSTASPMELNNLLLQPYTDRTKFKTKKLLSVQSEDSSAQIATSATGGTVAPSQEPSTTSQNSPVPPITMRTTPTLTRLSHALKESVLQSEQEKKVYDNLLENVRSIEKEINRIVASLYPDDDSEEQFAHAHDSKRQRCEPFSRNEIEDLCGQLSGIVEGSYSQQVQDIAVASALPRPRKGDLEYA